MKKAILFLALSIPAMVYAQKQVQEIPVKNLQAEVIKAADAKAVKINAPAEYTPGRSSLDLKNKKAKTYSYVLLAETYYDLQTNSSPGRRVILHDDGTISAVWTMSGDDNSGWPNRGSGYNHYNGSDWFTGVNERIESTTRTGWPSIFRIDDEEGIMAHESNTGGFILSKNGSIGSNSWTSSTPQLDDESVPGVNRVPIWNRTASGNGYLHTISNYWASDANNVPVVVRNGVSSPTTYSRSADGGQTWDKQHIMLPGYDSSLYIAGGGDNYAIDVRDSVVAIVMGGLGDPVSLWKSTNNGDSFTYIDVDNFAYKGRTSDVLMPDTPDCNDGSLDVLIDNDNVVHVFWGGSNVFDDDATDESFSFFPGTARLMHWKEGDTEPKICGSTIDMDGDGSLTINPETTNSLDANQNVPSGLLSAARTGNTSLVTMPSAAIDAQGNLFVVYSAPIETSLHFLNANFRDILVSYSTDGGDTWMGPQNLTQDRTTENNFPCVAKDANDFLHLIFQQDLLPGTHLQNHSPSAGTHPNDVNEIQYAAIPTSAILNNEIGANTLNVEEVEKQAKVFVVSQNQPNPFTGTSNVIVYLQSGADVTLTVTDMMGRTVNSGQLGVLSAGNHAIELDANGLKPGIYFYTIATPEHSVTKKMQVK